MKKSIALLLAVCIMFSTLLVSCSEEVISDSNGYTVINSTSSDTSAIVELMNANYVKVDTAKLSAVNAGRTIFVCVAEDGVPFDLTGFNDSGYIIRKVDDDIIICGKNETACQEAVDYFAKQYIDNGTYTRQGELVFAAELDYVHGKAGRLGKVTVDGVSIEEYKIVIPAEPTIFEDYASTILQDHFYDAGGLKVEIVNDSTTESEYEILIGKTSRSGSPTDGEYGELEYYLGVSGNDIVMDGNGYLVAGGIGKLIADYLEPEDCGDVALSLEEIGSVGIAKYKARKADSAILLIGDGMGFNSINWSLYEEYFDEFYGYNLPVQGESMTDMLPAWNAPLTTTDSAAGGTALSCGFKTGMTRVAVDLNGVELTSVRDLAYEMGARTAILSTTSIVDATPAVFLGHADSRYDTQRINDDFFEVTCEYTAGTVGWNLLDRVKEAVSIISEGGDPFFIMVEESQTDKGGHTEDIRVIGEALDRFNYTIAYSMVYCVAHTDTVMIITADHETGGIVKTRDGAYEFTSGGEHSDQNVPVLAIGYGTEFFHNVKKENIQIASFIGAIFGDEDFGLVGHSFDYVEEAE